MAGGHRRQRRGFGRLRCRFPGGRHRAAPDLLYIARRGRGVHPRRAGQPGRRRDPTRAVRRTTIRAVGAAGATRRRCAGDAGGGHARAGAALGTGWAGADRQRAARIRRGVRGPDADRRTGRGSRRRRRAGADGARPRAAGRTLGPHLPGPGAGGPSSDPLWWTVVAVCVAAIAISAGGRGQPRWRARVAIPRLPGAVRP